MKAPVSIKTVCIVLYHNTMYIYIWKTKWSKWWFTTDDTNMCACMINECVPAYADMHACCMQQKYDVLVRPDKTNYIRLKLMKCLDPMHNCVLVSEDR